MIYRILNESNIRPNLTDKYKLNLSNDRRSHARRIKIVGKGVGKEYGTEIPVFDNIMTFDELRASNVIHTVDFNDSAKYIDYIVGFIVLNHDVLVSYFDACDSGIYQNIDNKSQEVNKAFKSYMMRYDFKDTARIRRDANAYALQMRDQRL